MPKLFIATSSNSREFIHDLNNFLKHKGSFRTDDMCNICFITFLSSLSFASIILKTASF